METKDTLDNLRKEIDDLRRSNAIALQLYRASESNLDILMSQYAELFNMYLKMHNNHYNKMRENVEAHKPTDKDGQLLHEQFKEVLDMYAVIYDNHQSKIKTMMDQLTRAMEERSKIITPPSLQAQNSSGSGSQSDKMPFKL